MVGTLRFAHPTTKIVPACVPAPARGFWVKLSAHLLLIYFLFSPLSYACEVMDDAGQTIKLTQPAKRIISLAPDLTEILFAAGAGQQIRGVMRGSDYPPAAKQIPIIASFNAVDVEKVLTLHPDLIVVWGEGNLSQTLKKFGIPIYISHQKKLTDIPRTLLRLGCLAGTEKIAKKAAQDFLQRYHQLQQQYSHRKPVTVFFQVWLKPLITVTKNSWINDVIELCGGRNIFRDLHGAAPEVNLEAVISANPDFIIGTESKQDWRIFWKKWERLNAVKRNNLYAIQSDKIERASPRLLLGAAEMCTILRRG